MKMNWFINCQTRVWREYLQQKYQNKNTLQGFRGNTYSKNSKYKEKNIFFLSFLYIKGITITKETYENNGIEVITHKMKDMFKNN